MRGISAQGCGTHAAPVSGTNVDAAPASQPFFTRAKAKGWGYFAFSIRVRNNKYLLQFVTFLKLLS
jgi:hypothetical protein